MKVYVAANIRNIALVGHSGSGKTQLTSAALFDAGMVNRLGTVDDGTTVTDFDEEEIARKHTLSSTAAFAEWNKVKINIIDTPGIANFMSDTRAAMRVADAAVLVVDAVAGVEVQTEKVWAIASDLELPCLVVLNRLDRDRASLERSLASLREACGREIVPIQLQLGEEKTFTGAVDLVAMQAVSYSADGSGKATSGDIPAELTDAADAAREALVEMVAEADDGLMEKFFEAGTLTQGELEQGLRTAVNGRHLFSTPVHVSDSEHRHRVAARRDHYLSSIASRPAAAGRRCRRRADVVRRGRHEPRDGIRLEDDRGSVRGANHLVPSRLGVDQGRHGGSQQDARSQ